jgi:prepilin-type N-terminal cleavage/methylation domain-containing protein
MKRGFTLIEVLIVVIILGILATVAVPQFSKAIERARRAEAVMNIAAIQTALAIYYTDNSNSYTNSSLTGAAAINASLDCSIIANNWTYTSASGTNTFLITATRTASGGAAYSNKTITYSNSGTWGGNYDFIPKS